MRIFITDMYIDAQHMTEHSVDEILHHKNHKNQSREFILDKLRRKSRFFFKKYPLEPLLLK